MSMVFISFFMVATPYDLVVFICFLRITVDMSKVVCNMVNQLVNLFEGCVMIMRQFMVMFSSIVVYLVTIVMVRTSSDSMKEISNMAFFNMMLFHVFL